MVYKWCIVPQCTSTTIKTPEKLFVPVPMDPKKRKKWLTLARRDPNSISENSNVYMCEDHFDMKKDIENYMKFKMGFCKKLIVIDGVLPSKFHCQENHKRPPCDTNTSAGVFMKRQRQNVVEEGEQNNLQHCIATNTVKREPRLLRQWVRDNRAKLSEEQNILPDQPDIERDISTTVESESGIDSGGAKNNKLLEEANANKIKRMRQFSRGTTVVTVPNISGISSEVPVVTPKILGVAEINEKHVVTESLKNAELRHLKAINERLKRDIIEKNKRIDVLNVKIYKSNTATEEKMKKILDEKDKEIEQLRKRNYDLVDQLVKGLQELRDVIRENRQLKNDRHNHTNQLHPIGYRRVTDNMIHLGQDLWIPTSEFDSIVASSKSNSVFVKQCAEAIFGGEVLKNCTITESKYDADSKCYGRPALDPIKLLALRDIDNYYLTNIKKIKPGEVLNELNNIDSYLSKNIDQNFTRQKSVVHRISKGWRFKEERISDDDNHDLSYNETYESVNHQENNCGIDPNMEIKCEINIDDDFETAENITGTDDSSSQYRNEIFLNEIEESDETCREENINENDPISQENIYDEEFH